MLSRRSLLCLAAALLAPGAQAATRFGAEASGEVRVSGPAGQVGSTLTGPPVHLQLQTPLLAPSLGTALGAPVPAPAVQDLPTALDPLPPLAPAAVPSAPQAMPPAPGLGPSLSPPLIGAQAAPAEAGASPSGESLIQTGQVIFDQAAKLSGSKSAAPAVGESVRPAPAEHPIPQAPVISQPFSFGKWVKSLLQRPDQIPAWPGRTGDRVRLAGRTFVLGRRLGEGNSSVVYHADGGAHGYAVKFIHPEFRDLPYYGAEAEALQALARTDIPHARLVAHGPDGLVVVKEFVPGETGRALLEKGALRAHAKDNLPELAARLIAIGYTGDLAPGNLVWDHWSSAWTLVDGGGFRAARPWETLKQFLEGDFARKGGVDPARFLAAVRGRLGPDSQAWSSVLEDARSAPAVGKSVRPAPAELPMPQAPAVGKSVRPAPAELPMPQAPALRAHLEALAEADRSLPPAPQLDFAPGPASPELNDTMVTSREARRRLGFDPLSVRDRVNLHADDPGKLNTEVRELRLADRPGMVSKRSSDDVVRNELFLRRVVRRWFGRYFDAPRSVGYPLGGRESLLVMERVDGDKAYFDTRLTLPQRVALALLVHTFGVGDMNEGNVLYVRSGGVSLIDFEQALSRRRPNTSRIPDERIAAEMPWLSRRSANRAEDYLPGIRQWRELFLRSETKQELAAMLEESGFDKREVPRLLSVFRANLDDLTWTIQADAEFVNQFARSPNGEE